MSVKVLRCRYGRASRTRALGGLNFTIYRDGSRNIANVLSAACASEQSVEIATLSLKTIRTVRVLLGECFGVQAATLLSAAA